MQLKVFTEDTRHKTAVSNAKAGWKVDENLQFGTYFLKARLKKKSCVEIFEKKNPNLSLMVIWAFRFRVC